VVDDEEAGTTTVFALNRHLTEEMELRVELRGLGKDRKVKEATTLHHLNLKAVNTREAPHTVVPVVNKEVRVDGGELVARLKPGSWNVLVTTAGKR